MSQNKEFLSAEESLQRLKDGNKKFVAGEEHKGDISTARRKATVDEGQSPYAVVISCGDSRVSPEFMFHAGIGDLFVVRNAGQVIDAIELGNIEYALQHLNSKLIVVVGHTGCGAVAAAISGGTIRNLQHVTNHIATGLGDEKDTTKAEIKNVEYGMSRITQNPFVELYMREHGVQVVGAIYDTCTGAVNFL